MHFVTADLKLFPGQESTSSSIVIGGPENMTSSKFNNSSSCLQNDDNIDKTWQKCGRKFQIKDLIYSVKTPKMSKYKKISKNLACQQKSLLYTTLQKHDMATLLHIMHSYLVLR